jgi:hypothetical protein
MRTFILTLAVCLTGGIAHADLQYQFNVDASGPLEAFSFSFTVPTFVGDGDAPVFTPFTVTDGTNSWTMTEDAVATLGGVGCFEFGTGGGNTAFNFGNPCSEEVWARGGANGVLDFNFLGLPTATGTYGIVSGIDMFFVGDTNELAYPTGALTVSDVSGVPEPTSILLLASILGAVGGRLRKRAA